MTAIRSLFQAQLLRQHKELSLVVAGQFAAEAGYAQVRTGHPERAVLSLERGRSTLLAEALERDRADLDALGHGTLRHRFVQALERVHELESHRGVPGYQWGA